METVLADCSVSISELKKNPSVLINQADGEPIAVLNHNKPTAYLIPAKTYEELCEKLEDYELGILVKEREEELPFAVEVDIDAI